MDDDQYKLHLLVVAPSSEQPNRLISGLRSAGLTPHTGYAADARELSALLTRRWDLLLCYPTPSLAPAALLQVLRDQRCKLLLLLVDAPADASPLALYGASVQQLLSSTDAIETHIAAVLREAKNLQQNQRLQRLDADCQALTQRHDRLLHDSPIAHAYLLDGLHTYCNAAYARLFGFEDLAAMASTPLLNLVHPEERDRLRAVFGAAPPTDPLALRGRRQDGSELRLEFRFEALSGQNAAWLLRVQPAEQATADAPAQTSPLQAACLPRLAPTSALQTSSVPSPTSTSHLQTPSVASLPAASPHTLPSQPLSAGSTTDELTQASTAALAQVRQLLRERRFRLIYQALVPLRGTTPFGLDTSLQALDTDGRSLASSACMALAGRHGLGEELDQLLLVSALEALGQNAGGQRLILKLGGASLRSPHFLPWLGARLQAVPTLRSRLVIELSEIDIQDSVAQATVFCQGLAECGLPLVIGHFGCALAPFGILEKLHPVLLKLDQSLLQDLAHDPAKCASTQELIAHVHQRGLPVATCQADDTGTLPLLWQLGVDYAQGRAMRAPSLAPDCPVVTEQVITLTASQL
ncbi:MAG TPA: EAL domain-containing protein [Hyphomicrobiales bacterium]|nr:EAL domain-containing protein [Hyphomicrobiales bacterium]